MDKNVVKQNVPPSKKTPKNKYSKMMHVRREN